MRTDTELLARLAAIDKLAEDLGREYQAFEAAHTRAVKAAYRDKVRFRAVENLLSMSEFHADFGVRLAEAGLRSVVGDAGVARRAGRVTTADSQFRARWSQRIEQVGRLLVPQRKAS